MMVENKPKLMAYAFLCSAEMTKSRPAKRKNRGSMSHATHEDVGILSTRHRGLLGS